MISSIPSRRSRRRRHRRTKHPPYLVVRSPPREFPRASTSTSRSFPIQRAEHCRVRDRRARQRTRSLVVVHSFDDPVYTYSRGFNPIYLLPVCKHARTHERSFCRSSTSTRTRAITKREKNDESQTIKFSMNRRIVLSTCTGIVRDEAVRGWDVFVRTRG